MSSFGGMGGGSAAQQTAQSTKMARFELEGVSDMFNRMSDMCFRKCVTRYSEGDLATAEQACIDRCVVKYMDVQGKVGKRLNDQMLAQQQQMQQQQQQ